MGVEASKYINSDDSLISHVCRYDWQRVYYTYKALVDRKYSSLSCSTINTAIFSQLLKFPRFITNQLISIFDYNDTHTVHWRHCLSGLLLCTQGDTTHKFKLLLQLHDISGPSIDRSTCVRVLTTSVSAARSIISGSKINESLEDLIDPVLEQEIETAFTNIAHVHDEEIALDKLESWSHEHSQFVQSLVNKPTQRPVDNVSFAPSMTYKPVPASRDVNKSTCYSWQQVAHDDDVPKTRTKHAMCARGGCVYMYGGKDKTAYKDMWKYELVEDKWCRLTTSGVKPPSLQGHTLLPHKNKLYMFGGDFGFCGEEDVPLWTLDLDSLCWSKYSDPDTRGPSSRRDHAAVICGTNMFVYGGYVDLKGSNSELWSFSIDEESWTLLYSGPYTSEAPGPRHGHTAVIYKKCMWIYGGMSDLQSRDDMWKWNTGLHQWMRVKPRGSPPALSDHTASVVGDSMYVFGGSRDGNPHNELWAFHFDSLTWHKLSTSTSPPPSIQHCAITVSPFMLQNADSSCNTGERARSLPYLKPKQHGVHDRPRSSPGYLKSIKNHLIPPNRIAGDGIAVGVNDRMHVVTPATPSVKHKMTSVDDVEMRALENDGFETTTFMETDNGEKSVLQNKLVVRYEQRKDLNQNNQSKQVIHNAQQSRLETKLRRSVLSRQTSSCESVNAGQGGRDFVPLLKKRSSTIGDLSLDSNSGFDNPSFLNSSQGSAGFSDVTRENTESVPVKKRCSDENVCFGYHRSSSADSIIDSKQNKHGKKMDNNMKKKVSFSTEMLDSMHSESFNCVIDNIGAVSNGYNYWAEEYSSLSPRSRSKQRSGSRSSSCDDLILEDIEDCDMQTLIDQSNFLFQNSQPDNSLHRDGYRFESSDKSNLLPKSSLRNNEVEMQVFVNKSAVLHPTDISVEIRNKQKNNARFQNSSISQSGSRIQRTNQSEKTMDITFTNKAFNQDIKTNQSSSAPVSYDAPRTRGAASKYVTHQHTQGPEAFTYHIYIFGGKQKVPQNFGVNPITTWKLVINLGTKEQRQLLRAAVV